MGANIIIIGIHGAIKSGKDTSADYINECLTDVGIKTHRIAFADKMKKLAAEMCGIPLIWFYDQELKKSPITHLGNITPREVMRKFGTDFGTDMIHPSVWNQHVEKFIKERFTLSYENEVIFVTDVRFPNEAQLIKDYGGYLLEVTRTDGQIETSSHRSDAGLGSMTEAIDFRHTNKNLEELRTNCIALSKFIIETINKTSR